jgi:putative ABC transport system permease protein
MKLLYRFRALMRWLFRRDELERALDTDLADYIERSAAEKMRAGMTETEARRAARIELGGVEQTKENVRVALSFAWIDNTLADLGYALRTLSRQKTFTTVAVLTLALGIGVNVAIFSLFQRILLQSLPVPEPDRLVNLTDPETAQRTAVRMDPRLFATSGGSKDGGGDDTLFSYPMFRDLERAQEPFVGLAGYNFDEATISIDQRTRPATLVYVSGSYFTVLGLTPALGRLLGPDDDRVDGQAESVVLSHAYWQSEFGGNPSVLGRTLTVNDVPLTIVGVAPRGFHGTALSVRPSVFVPITISSGVTDGLPALLATPNHSRRDHYWVRLLGRLAPGVTEAEATLAMNTLYRAILSEVEAPLLSGADDQQREVFRSRPLELVPGARGQTGARLLDPARNSLELLFAVSGGVLLLCCANVAGLILLRAATRSGELAVRASLGASRGRLASLQLAESVVLALPAAILSLPVAWVALRGASQVPGIPEAAPDVSLSGAAAFVAIAIAVASALAVGLVPIRGVTRTEPAKALQTYGARQTAAKGVARFRAALAIAQVALSMVLLAMTGVFAQSLANIARLDLGADIDSVVMFEIGRRDGITLPGKGVNGSTAGRLEEALAAIPGVSSTASSLSPLLSLKEGVFNVALEGVEAEPLRTSGDRIGPNFFGMFGTELLAGREFSATDLASVEAGQRVVVNRRLAERFGIAPDAMVGRRIDAGARRFDTGAAVMFEIVGVIGDLRLSGKVTEDIQPQVFFPTPVRDTFYVRGALPPDALLNAVRETVARVDPTMPVWNLQTMEQQFRTNIAIERFVAGTATAFAVLATALAALGLYGVLAYSVSQRSREIGLRIALGAPTSRIRGMVLRQVTGMAVVGIVLGATTAALLGRAAQSLLFGVKAGDPLMLAAAAVVLATVTLGAAYLPARRASRIDPASVLRYE